ncbi:putative PEP-CTERM system TPR-repeat lipoprotein [Salinivirga cyanobacteriivorans]|uniref:Putative PEP-CTERM system TPR-repeat lipoprotein n=1 Tax=Salinivirga cyanobacteriivorans TaxID=1307839 RepID=A0A0S2HUS8_9BACT|nr:hypothetical protein [Salinivirga cyanobacteriivorans]ALO13732.1 putative PEP-CTERM system TPR-repeat lipoprotein [Salinivirga cyanobacteriivorans]
MDKALRKEKIYNLIENYNLEEALHEIDEILKQNSQDIDALCFKGKILTKQQQYGDALNIYKHVLRIDPDHEKATTSINMINNILKIRRTFYFENTYTDDELYS